MLSFDGRTTMLTELGEIRRQLVELDKQLMEVGAEWRLDHGITDEAVRRELDKMKAEAGIE
jgi:hypothetical protein